ncbi:MAG: hypothetical protein IKR76_12345 [Ruminococcus sp.]|nr:hypothetical protein [Ruminococcus sp.]
MLSAYNSVNWYMTLLFYVGVPILLLLILFAILALVSRQGLIMKEFQELNRNIARLASKSDTADSNIQKSDTVQPIQGNIFNDPDKNTAKIDMSKIESDRDMVVFIRIVLIGVVLIMIALICTGTFWAS